jgi:hypothetical protein
VTTPTPDTPDDAGAAGTKIVITYDPPGQDAQVWQFEPGTWTVGEVRLIEQYFRKPRDEFFEDVAEGFETARVFMLWLVRRRKEPNLELEDLDDLLSAYIGLGQIAAEPPIDRTDPEAVDPEPDGVNDPKAGRPGPNDETPVEKQPTSNTPGA